MLYLVETEKNVILLRNARGLSQEQAALEAGISPGRWQQLEKGSKNTTLDTLRRMAKVVHVAPQVMGVLSLSDGEILAIHGPGPPGRAGPGPAPGGPKGPRGGWVGGGAARGRPKATGKSWPYTVSCRPCRPAHGPAQWGRTSPCSGRYGDSPRRSWPKGPM